MRPKYAGLGYNSGTLGFTGVAPCRFLALDRVALVKMCNYMSLCKLLHFHTVGRKFEKCHYHSLRIEGGVTYTNSNETLSIEGCNTIYSCVVEQR